MVDKPRLIVFALAFALLTGCATSLVPTQRVEHLGVVGREPMLAEHPDGTLFVAGYGEPRPTLWKSSDRGATWTRVDVGTEADGAIGNSDVDLAVAPDGTLYFASMLYDRTANEGVQIAIGVSHDTGATWRWTTLSKTRFDDRPWVEVAPDGTAHAIWNDGSGISWTISRDRGATWTEQPRIHDKGGSSHLAIGPAGELAVRITPLSASANQYDEGLDLIAVSTDAGATWQKHPAPGIRDWSPDFESEATPRWVEPLAWDHRGRLYSLWTDKKGVRLACSDDRGAHWRTSTVIDTAAPAFFPYLIAHRDGQLAATWFTGSRKDRSDLQWYVARIDARIDGRIDARIDERPVLSAPQPINTTAGEYLALAFLRDHTLAVVTPIQNRPANRLGFTWWKFAEK